MLKTLLIAAALILVLLVFVKPDLPARIDGWLHQTAETVGSTARDNLPAIPALGTPSAAATSDNAQVTNTGVHKCVDARGNATFSNLPCAGDEKTRAVKLSPTMVIDLRAQNARGQGLAAAAPAASAPAPAANNGAGNVQTALRQKFAPAN